MQPKPFQTRTRRSYVYIDLANVFYRERTLVHISLPVLLTHIEKHALMGSVLKTVTLYVHPNDPNYDDGVYDRFKEKMAESGVTIQVTYAPRKKDVDHLLVNDLWRNTVEGIEYGKRANRSLRHVIVSGDGAFAQTCIDIRSALVSSPLDMEVAVYSWRDSLAMAWRRSNVPCHLLENIPNIIEPADPPEPPIE